MSGSEARIVQTAPSNPQDEAFLDELFDRFVDLLDDGKSPDLSLAIAGNEHLRARALEILALARQVTVQPAEAVPQIAGFAVLRKLGQGGMGAVYLARQERLNRTVALKILPHELTTPRMRERFTREAEALARLRHPNIVTVYDVVADPHLSAYAMECIDGMSLADLIQKLCDASIGGNKPTSSRSRSRDSLATRATMETVRALLNTPPDELTERSYVAFIARLGLAIARALTAVHDAGLLHRDIKPSNILLRRDGTPLLSDFGLVRDADATLTQPGSFAGTPAYAPPEQLRGDSDALDARSDVYALGATLYHALAMRLPLPGRNPNELLRQIDSGGPAPLRKLNSRLPVDLETIVSKALEPDPNRRYQSADALADDLERLLTLQPIRAKPAGLLTRSIKLVRRNRGIFAGTIAGTLAAAAVSNVLLLYLVFVPRWVAEHVREARLALLDPRQANNIISMLYWGQTHTDPLDPLSPRARQFDSALAEYAAARRWAPQDTALQREMEVARAVRDGRPAPSKEVRNAGLHAFLTGDFERAISSWSTLEAMRDPLTEPDPLVSAALGVLYLFDDQPARAYPRLRDAVRAFPNVGFLTLYLADAALQSGDVSDAERLFELALKQPHPDDERGQLRLRAALLAATGHDSEAEALYRAQPSLSGPTLLQFARFLDNHGRLEEALSYYATTAQLGSANCRPARTFRAALDRWWGGLSAIDRERQITQTLYANAAGGASFRHYLTVYGVFSATHAGKRVAPQAELLAAFPGPLQFLPFLAALPEAFLSPSLQSLSLSELAQRMEVADMRIWNQLIAAPNWKKAVVQAAWRQPALRPLARRLIAWQSAATTLIIGAANASGQCTSPPCFQGLGDLPGGDTSSATAGTPRPLSADGSTVVGTSESGSGPQAFRWNAATGMVGLGEGAGGSYYSGAQATSADGSRVVGVTISGNVTCGGYEGFIWSQDTGLTLLGDAPDGCFWSDAHDISADASVIAGVANDLAGYHAAFWTQGTWNLIGGIGTPSSASAISADGSVIAGQLPTLGSFRWSASTGLTDLGYIPGGAPGNYVYSMSADGNVIVGRGSAADGLRGFRWTQATGMVGLQDLSGGGVDGFALGISPDGSLIVGYGASEAGREATIWDSTLNVQRAADVLASHGVEIPSGWFLTRASGVALNDNVVTICGDALNAQGGTEAWIARYTICTSPPCFQGLGDLPGGAFASYAFSLSSDGSTVVGRSIQAAGEEAFRWRAATGIQGLGDLPGGSFLSKADDVSGNGDVIAGASDSSTSNGYPYEAFRWTSQTGLIALGPLSGATRSQSRGISDDGEVIVGWLGGSSDSAFRWTSSGMHELSLPAGNIGVAMAVTADGTTAFGWAGSTDSDTQLVRWIGEGAVEELGRMRGPGSETSPYRVSDDGQHVVGYACVGDCDPFEWTPGHGFTNLGDLAGGLTNGHAFGISGDARLIVGDSTSSSGAEAVIWNEGRTIHRVSEILAQGGVVVPAGWQLTRSMAVTINGDTATLVGDGLNPQGDPEAWIARYTIAPPPCLGDLDHDRDVDLSDLAIALGNYGCTSACVADLDADGDMDLSDLSIMLSRYGAICP